MKPLSAERAQAEVAAGSSGRTVSTATGASWWKLRPPSDERAAWIETRPEAKRVHATKSSPPGATTGQAPWQLVFGGLTRTGDDQVAPPSPDAAAAIPPAPKSVQTT